MENIFVEIVDLLAKTRILEKEKDVGVVKCYGRDGREEELVKKTECEEICLRTDFCRCTLKNETRVFDLDGGNYGKRQRISVIVGGRSNI